jgi:hypothetical protein
MKCKAAILAEYDGPDEAGKGALSRREGLHTSLIDAWRKQRDRGGLKALDAPAGRPTKDPRDSELDRLRGKHGRLANKLETAERVIEFRESSPLVWRASRPRERTRRASNQSGRDCQETLRSSPRLTVDSARPTSTAIVRSECPACTPSAIFTRSASLK